MKHKLLPVWLSLFFVCAVISSCRKMDALQGDDNANSAQSGASTLSNARLSSRSKISPLLQKASEDLKKKILELKKVDELSEYISSIIIAAQSKNAVQPSECSATDLNRVVAKYASGFNEYDRFLYFDIYLPIGLFSTLFDNSPKQYFGEKGELTSLVVRQQKKLESFWKMPGEVKVNGWHNSQLNDRDKIAQVYMILLEYPSELAYAIADILISINNVSPIFIETPLLSANAFAASKEIAESLSNGHTTTDVIGLGDGIIQLLAEAGISKDISTTGIFAHEWAHQVQFNFSEKWFGYRPGNWPREAEFTRLTELHADFFASYYSGHKKGALIHWSKLSQFFNVFYNIGDCSFDNADHHGTPNQRMAAARSGFLLATLAGLTGTELSADDLNALFMAVHNSVFNNTMSTKTAMASLKSKKLQSIYAMLLMYRSQLQSIQNGKLNKSQISNL